jgi:hypothetical protein
MWVLLDVAIDIDIAFGEIIELTEYVILRLSAGGLDVFFLGLPSIKKDRATFKIHK